MEVGRATPLYPLGHVVKKLEVSQRAARQCGGSMTRGRVG